MSVEQCTYYTKDNKEICKKKTLKMCNTAQYTDVSS